MILAGKYLGYKNPAWQFSGGFCFYIFENNFDRMTFSEFLKKINFPQSKDNPSELSSTEKFINDMQDNEVIYIDKIPYLKVKIKFVETIDYNTSRRIDMLEQITEEQEKQITQLTQSIVSKDSIILSLENLARNTKHELELKVQHQKEHIAKIQETINTKNEANAELRRQSEALNKTVKCKNEEIIKLNKDLLSARSAISLLQRKRK
jgi:chromosome segregation ATPase